MKQSQKLFIAGVFATATLGAGALPVFAETTNTTTVTPTPRAGGMGMMGIGVDLSRNAPGVFGSVTAKNGTTLTIKDGRSGTLYTVETSGAKIQNAEIVGTLDDIAVGDRVRAEGTVTGSSVAASRVIKYRMMQGAPGGRGGMMGDRGSSSPMAITGNGKPVVMGTVASITGTSFTITNNGGTYTIDASSAKIVKPGVTTPTTATLAVGDVVTVQGSITGNAVVASSVIDQTPATGPASSGDNDDAETPRRGFMGTISHFFASLFGF